MISIGSSIDIANEIGLALERNAGTGRGGDAEVTGEGGAERHAGGGDLVLGLDRANAEVLVLGELVEDVGRRA